MLNRTGTTSLSRVRPVAAGAPAPSAPTATPSAPAETRLAGDRSLVRPIELSLAPTAPDLEAIDWSGVEKPALSEAFLQNLEWSLMERRLALQKKTPEQEMQEKLQKLKQKMDQAVTEGNVAMLVKLAGALNVLANTPGIKSGAYRQARFMMMDLREGFKEALKPLQKKVEQAIASGDVNMMKQLAAAISGLANTPNLDPSLYKDLRKLLSQVREAIYAQQRLDAAERAGKATRH